jgi:hypothetical protein
MQDGKPAFVVIRFDEYVRLFPKAPRIPQGDIIPHEVVGLTVKKGLPLSASAQIDSPTASFSAEGSRFF